MAKEKVLEKMIVEVEHLSWPSSKGINCRTSQLGVILLFEDVVCRTHVFFSFNLFGDYVHLEAFTFLK